jgi:hypothetical protein
MDGPRAGVENGHGLGSFIVDPRRRLKILFFTAGCVIGASVGKGH